MNLHKSTLCDFGQEYVKPIQDYEHTVKELAQHRNHLHFNLHCKHHGVMPVSLHLSTNAQETSANKGY